MAQASSAWPLKIATALTHTLHAVQGVLARLQTDGGAKHVVAQLAALRALLFAPARMQVLVAGDLSKACADGASPWVLLAEALAPPPADHAEKAKAAAEAPDDDEDDEGDDDDDDDGEEGEGGGEEGGEIVCKPAEEIDHFATIESEAAATAAVSSLPVPAAGLATGVAAHHIRTGVSGVGLICPLASIESSYVRLNAPVRRRRHR